MRPSLRLNLARVAVGLMLLAPIVPVDPVTAVACSDVHVVFARGANRAVGDFDFTGFVVRDLKSRIGAPSRFPSTSWEMPDSTVRSTRQWTRLASSWSSSGPR